VLGTKTQEGWKRSSFFKNFLKKLEPFKNERFLAIKLKFFANRKFGCGFKDNSV
jgi:hypothetical protein